jgi:putative restriction endonuclease
MDIDSQLQWFRDNLGTESVFPDPLPNGDLLATRAKGIYKPAGSQFALSVRTQLNSKYSDGIFVSIFERGWAFAYHEETDSRLGSNLFTNKALEQNILNNVPVGVLEEIENSHDPKKCYFVHGLGIPIHKQGSYFIFCDEKTALSYSRVKILNAFYTANAATVSVSSEDSVPEMGKDLRTSIFRSIVVRQGQGRFRREIIQAYDGKCAVTKEPMLEVLDAAHIMPYLGKHTNNVNNGLLLRTDLHNLFDFNLLSIEPSTWKINIHPEVNSNYYRELHGIKLSLPTSTNYWPSTEYLQERWKIFQSL